MVLQHGQHTMRRCLRTAVATRRALSTVPAHAGALQSWEEVWKSGNTPFHLDSVSDELVRSSDFLLGRQLDQLDQSLALQALVPLSGASLDVVFLAGMGFDVVAVEFSQAACEVATRLWGLTSVGYRVTDQCTVHSVGQVGPGIAREVVGGPPPLGRLGGITLLLADIFDVTPQHVPRASVVWDRAGVTSLADDGEAVRYFAHLGSMCQDQARLVCAVVSTDVPEGVAGLPPLDETLLQSALSQAGWSDAALLHKEAVTDLYPDFARTYPGKCLSEIEVGGAWFLCEDR
jgi:hypothetical protein